MKKRDRFIKFILKPPMWFCIVVWSVGALSLAATITLYYVGLGLTLWALPVHITAALFFLLSIYATLTVVGVLDRVKDKPRVRQFFSSYGTRAFVYAFCSAAFNIAYVVFGIIIACVERSLWLGVLVGYHVFLVLPRAEVLIVGKLRARSEGADAQKQQLLAYTHCGLMLILLGLAIIPVIRMTMQDRNTYNYFLSTTIYVIVIALHTTVKMSIALYNFRKARKQNDMAVIAVKNVSFADALISVFALQALMLKELGDDKGLLKTLNPAIGGIVVAAIFIMGLCMLIGGNRRLKRLERDVDATNEENGRERP